LAISSWSLPASSAGQTLVSTGVFKLRNGMGVVVDNKLAPRAATRANARQFLMPGRPPLMKSFTDLFISRPVLAIVASLLIIIAGLQAIGSLNVRQYPRSDNARSP
jgi:hypothetical protein